MSDNHAAPAILRIAAQVLHMCILKCNILDRQTSPICDMTDKAKKGVPILILLTIYFIFIIYILLLLNPHI